jgi:hypothetical protein
LVLRLNQETVHDFIVLFMPPCGPHLTPLATGSLKQSLLVFSTPGGLTGDDLSRLFFTCTNTSQAATCTCNLKQPVKTKKMTKPEDKPVPMMVQKWVPKIATPAKSVDPK